MNLLAQHVSHLEPTPLPALVILAILLFAGRVAVMLFPAISKRFTATPQNIRIIVALVFITLLSVIFLTAAPWQAYLTMSAIPVLAGIVILSLVVIAILARRT